MLGRNLEESLKFQEIITVSLTNLNNGVFHMKLMEKLQSIIKWNFLVQKPVVTFPLILVCIYQISFSYVFFYNQRTILIDSNSNLLHVCRSLCRGFEISYRILHLYNLRICRHICTGRSEEKVEFARASVVEELEMSGNRRLNSQNGVFCKRI